jgi:hypothetical protein
MVEVLLEELDMGEIGAHVCREAGRLRSGVEFADLGVFDRKGLERFLEGIETGLVGLAATVESTYFRPAGPIFMHSYEAF